MPDELADGNEFDDHMYDDHDKIMLDALARADKAEAQNTTLTARLRVAVEALEEIVSYARDSTVIEVAAAVAALSFLKGQEGKTVDPREPDPTREGIFRDHNCSRCEDGRRICVRLDPRGCEFPVARND